jgi:hypothetical protein
MLVMMIPAVTSRLLCRDGDDLRLYAFLRQVACFNLSRLTLKLRLLQLAADVAPCSPDAREEIIVAVAAELKT